MARSAVFAFPVSLEFYPAARPTHKQLLTLYNPYDFPVNFKVLSTSPHKFTLIDPEGVISPLSCIDIIIRYSQPSSSHCNGTDKFRITMLNRSNNSPLGKRDITVKFLPGEPENVNPEAASDMFQPLLMKGTNTAIKQDHGMCNYPLHRAAPTNYIAISIGIICIFALLMPTQMEPASNSSLPSYLHLSCNLKLIISFVLGLVSMVLLRP